MGRVIILIKDRYFEWSTVVDAPVSPGMTLKELRRYIRRRYGTEGLSELAERLERVQAKGTSSLIHDSLEEEILLNRAGPRETRITADEIYELYTEKRADGGRGDQDTGSGAGLPADKP